MRQVRVEGHAVTSTKLMALAVDDESRFPFQDHRRLAAAGLVDRGVSGTAGDRAGIQPVNRDVRALPGQGRSQLLDTMPAAAVLPPLAPAQDHDMPILV